jgi:hypothetical protein
MLSPRLLLLWFTFSQENRDLGRWDGTVFGGLRQFGALPGCLGEPVVSHHAQIWGLVHGAATHENSATMSLYGYGLT